MSASSTKDDGRPVRGRRPTPPDDDGPNTTMGREERTVGTWLKRRDGAMRSFLTVAVLATIMVLGSAGAADAAKARTDIYGYVMMDAGYNSIGIDPAWFDVQRPTKLPAFENQHGEDG